VTAQRVVALDIVMKGSVHCLISMTVLSGEIVQPGMVQRHVSTGSVCRNVHSLLLGEAVTLSASLLPCVRS